MKGLVAGGALAAAGKTIYDRVRSKSRKRRSPSSSSADSYVPSRTRRRDRRRSPDSDTGITRRSHVADDRRREIRDTRATNDPYTASGGALTREKIVAAASNKFVCMVDESKSVQCLGREFPVPIEVLPQARSYVARQLARLGGEPVYREDFVTDYGNVILDTYDLDVSNPLAFEQELNNIVGVVCNGIFAANQADVLLRAGSDGVTTLTR